MTTAKATSFSEADMDVEPFLHPKEQRTVVLPLDYRLRCELRGQLGEELFGEPIDDRSLPDTAIPAFFDFENRAVSAGDLFHDDRTWIVVDTAFGCRYLALADYKGGFVLLSLMPGVYDVLVEFDRSVPTDHPSRHADDSYNPVPRRNRKQYLMFLSIADDLVAESERLHRS